MSITDWIAALNHWLDTEADTPGEIERFQARLMLGSCLTIMARELCEPDAAYVRISLGVTGRDADEYRARFAGHAKARVELNTCV
jgi:hypothetical protein